MIIPDIGKADTSPAWCPGCGNFPILKVFNQVLEETNLDTRNLVLVSGIGQAAKLPHYLGKKVNVFNGLHGRAIPAATGIKIANHELNVVITSGDGDMYGEGGNHFLHAIRRNVSIKAFVHNNQVYGLTKGQASPTSDEGFVTPVQIHGVTARPFNPLAIAIVEDCPFVARSFAGDQEHLSEMMKLALEQEHGFALLDILQPCVTFNNRNTYKWYKERVKKIGDDHNPTDKSAALGMALKWDHEIPIGVIYRCHRPSFEQSNPVLEKGTLVNSYSG